jgi:DNA-binding HxlR family transcriptional regulator
MPKNRNENVRRLLQNLGQAWTPEVLASLSTRPSRFNELKHELGISANALSRVLHILEQSRFVSRFESPALQRHVAYELTDAGRALHDIALSCGALAQEQEQAFTVVRHGDDPNASRDFEDVDTVVLSRDEIGMALGRKGKSIAYAAVVVHDLQAAARAWADVFNVPVPDISDVYAELPRGGETALRSAWLQFKNIRINLIQPVDRFSPFADHLDQRGQGFHHVGFYVDNDLRTSLDQLRAEGGTHVLGTNETSYGEFDCRATLGTVIELNGSSGCCHASARLDGIASLGSTSIVSGLTIAVRDIHGARRHYGSTLGMSMSPVRTIHCLEHSRTGSRKASAVIGTIRQNSIVLNVVQPVSGGLFDRSVDRFGSEFYHLGFRVRQPLDALVGFLEKKNGRMVAGAPAAGYVQIDLVETLGVIIDIAGGGQQSHG